MTQVKIKRKSRFQGAWRRLKKSRTAIIGMVLLSIVVFCALFADLIYDYRTDAIKQNSRIRLQGPSWAHPFGTDEFGRDILARIVFGTRSSLYIGLMSCLLCCLVGVTCGALAGYFGGIIDDIFMRFFDVLLAVPSILLAIIIVASLGANLFNIIVAISLSIVPQYVRITRASVMMVKDMEYIEAARAIGSGTFRIIVSHILPNCFAPILVQATLRVATVIADAACLSFLGLGIPPPAPEWGAMLSAGRGYLRDAPHIVIFPGLAIMLTILALNMLGDGLRDALDPKLKT
jgi:peptide/nickel transport system permease protein